MCLVTMQPIASPPSNPATLDPMRFPPSSRPDASAEGRTTYSTAVLFGRRDEPLLTVAARQLVEAAVAAGYTK